MLVEYPAARRRYRRAHSSCYLPFSAVRAFHLFGFLEITHSSSSVFCAVLFKAPGRGCTSTLAPMKENWTRITSFDAAGELHGSTQRRTNAKAPATGEVHTSPSARVTTKISQGQIPSQSPRNLPLPPEERPGRCASSGTAASAAPSTAAVAVVVGESLTHAPATSHHVWNLRCAPWLFVAHDVDFPAAPGLTGPVTVARWLVNPRPLIQSHTFPLVVAPGGRFVIDASSFSAAGSLIHFPSELLHVLSLGGAPTG